MNDELNAAIVRDLAREEPLTTTNEGPIGQTTEVGCVLCGAEGPPPSAGDEFQHELSCPWLRARIMQLDLMDPADRAQLRRMEAHDRDVAADPGLRRDIALLGGDPSL